MALFGFLRRNAALRAPSGKRQKPPAARGRLMAVGAEPSDDGPALDPRLANPPKQVGWAMTARILGIGLTASALSNVALGALVFDFATRLRIQPMLLTVSPKADQVVRVEPFQTGTRGFALLTEALIADYVRQRHSIVRDGAEMKRRWGGQGHVWRYSVGAEYDLFTKELRRGAGKLLDAGVSRAVHLLSNPVRVDQGFYRTDFATVDCSPEGKEIDRAAWTASVAVAYATAEVRTEERYMNPIGLQVTAYSVQRKHDAEALGVGGCISNTAGIIEAMATTGVRQSSATAAGAAVVKNPAGAARAALPASARPAPLSLGARNPAAARNVAPQRPARGQAPADSRGQSWRNN